MFTFFPILLNVVKATNIWLLTRTSFASLTPMPKYWQDIIQLVNDGNNMISFNFTDPCKALIFTSERSERSFFPECIKVEMVNFPNHVLCIRGNRFAIPLKLNEIYDYEDNFPFDSHRNRISFGFKTWGKFERGDKSIRISLSVNPTKKG